MMANNTNGDMHEIFEVYQDYMNKYFRVPEELCNDIVYCQRAIIEHLQVRQLLLETFKKRQDISSIQKQRILIEINDQLFRINAEQSILCTQLREMINDFIELVERDHVVFDRIEIEKAVSRTVAPLIHNKAKVIKPTNVEQRASATALSEHYFQLFEQKTPVFEITDSDDDNDEQRRGKMQQMNYDQDNDDDVVLVTNDKPLTRNAGFPGPQKFRKQKFSLLKSSKERYLGNYTDPQQFLKVELLEEKSDDGMSTVSQNVSMSRQNLRQALKKAQAAANVVQRAETQTPTNVLKPMSSAVQQQKAAVVAQAQATTWKSRVLKKNEVKKATRGAVAAAHAAAIAAAQLDKVSYDDLNSSSEESNHDVTPPEYRDLRLRPEVTFNKYNIENYGQTTFLRMFELYTPEVVQQLQQRRSKRKRRNVQKNERTDYLYGRIEYGNGPPEKKKRKAFLMSPQLKRGLQSKAQKRASTEKRTEEAVSSSRSNSCSPNAKRCCNECLKTRGGGVLLHCAECLSYYHESCSEEAALDADSSNSSNDNAKLCPSCWRKKQKMEAAALVDEQALKDTAETYKATLQMETKRKKTLQDECNKFKVQMNSIFNAVKTIKNAENPASLSD